MFKNCGEYYPFTVSCYAMWYMECVFDLMKLPRQEYWLRAYPQFIQAMSMDNFSTAIDAIENDIFGAF